MRVDVSIARNAFHSLVRRAAEGESVVIVRHGKPIAQLRGFKRVEGVKLLSADDLIRANFRQRRNDMADETSTAPQPEPDDERKRLEIAQTWNAVLLAATRRIVALEQGQADLQARLTKLEALLTGGADA